MISLDKAKIQYRSTRYATFLLNYRFVWCPKYKGSILDNSEVVETIEEAIIEVADDMQCSIISLRITSDHVELSLSALPRFSPARLIGRIKGKSGSRVAARFPDLKNRGKIWNDSYFCITVGDSSTEDAQKYIGNQLKRIK